MILAADVCATFNDALPGYGPDAYLPAQPMVHDMALGWYGVAVCLLGDTEQARLVGDQLKATMYKESPKFPGWGLGFAYTPPRGTGASTTLNPPGAVYGVTTAICARALFDISDLTGDESYAETARAALDYYVARSFHVFADKGFFYYSNQSFDITVDIAIYNVTAMLMAAFARAYAKWGSATYLDCVNRCAKYLWSRKVTQPVGFAWPYRSDQTGLNDPVHAAYMEIGFLEYNRYVPNSPYDLSGMIAYSKQHAIEMESASQKLWGIGGKIYSLSLASEGAAATRLRDTVLPRLATGSGRYSWIEGETESYVRHDAHNVAGLAELEAA